MLHVFDAATLLKHAWDLVTMETIMNCFLKASTLHGDHEAQLKRLSTKHCNPPSETKMCLVDIVAKSKQALDQIQSTTRPCLETTSACPQGFCSLSEIDSCILSWLTIDKYDSDIITLECIEEALLPDCE